MIAYGTHLIQKFSSSVFNQPGLWPNSLTMVFENCECAQYCFPVVEDADAQLPLYMNWIITGYTMWLLLSDYNVEINTTSVYGRV
jgi:hypothetical protein